MNAEKLKYIDGCKKCIEARKKMKKREDVEKMDEKIKEFKTRAEQIKAKQTMILKLTTNKFQPPPIMKEISENVTREKINEDIEPNEFVIKFNGSDKLKTSGANYIKYSLTFNGQSFENHFDISQDE